MLAIDYLLLLYSLIGIFTYRFPTLHGSILDQPAFPRTYWADCKGMLSAAISKMPTQAVQYHLNRSCGNHWNKDQA
jgi:hypothetical protein